MRGLFDRLSARTAQAVGHPLATSVAVLAVLAWLAWGPIAGWSDTWQLWANTATTIVTFLMVFLIQAAVNRNEKALHAKIDELIRALPEANNDLRGVERKN